MSGATLSNNLIRILRRESADHPLMAEAVEAQSDLLAGIDWEDPDDVRMVGARLADGIEDWVGHRGQFLHHYIREPYLSGWRATCRNALLEARRDTLNLIR